MATLAPTSQHSMWRQRGAPDDARKPVELQQLQRSHAREAHNGRQHHAVVASAHVLPHLAPRGQQQAREDDAARDGKRDAKDAERWRLDFGRLPGVVEQLGGVHEGVREVEQRQDEEAHAEDAEHVADDKQEQRQHMVAQHVCACMPVPNSVACSAQSRGMWRWLATCGVQRAVPAEAPHSLGNACKMTTDALRSEDIRA